MKNVSISYNPYKLKTYITVDGKELAENSKLRERSAEGNRLQEWVEDLPDMLLDELNENKFTVSFHGTIMDYEDLKEVLDEAQKQKKFLYNLKWEKAQEAADKEKLIDEVFAEIQEGPFEELKSDEIKTAFQNAKSNDFEVCVVATMSAGKSTLINAMLGKELMPSKAGACTAMITRIKDVDRLKDSFRAEVYRKGRISESYEKLNYSTMERLNEDDKVDEVRVYGNMPFVSSDELSLVLVDTPGPNNARDDSHEEVQQNALGKSSKALVLYIMTNEYGTDDDEITLRRVANTMSVGGKQSKDRFLFVVNKMDSRNKNDGSTEETLDQVREYLKAQGINNPNLFPAAALPALNIRRMEKEKVDEDIEEETEFLIRKLNRNEQLHLEKYASLPGNEKDDIEEQLKETQKDWKEKEGEKYENPQEALIHTGIVSIEAAIRQYVEKYAKTARIKNIVDTFQHEVEELDYDQKTKKMLAENKAEREKILNQIKTLQDQIDHNVGETKGIEDAQFETEINNGMAEIKSETEQDLFASYNSFTAAVMKKFGPGISDRPKKIEVDQIEGEVDRLEKYVKELEPAFKSDLNETIQKKLQDTCQILLKKYIDKLKKLVTEVPVKDMETIRLDPVTMVRGSIIAEKFTVDSLIRTERIEGEEWIENTNKKWYKPWTWFQEKGYWRKTYKDHQYIEYSDFYQKYIKSIDYSLMQNISEAKKYANEQIDKVEKQFLNRIQEINKKLKNKLANYKAILESQQEGERAAKEIIDKIEHNRKWLEDIQDKVDKILEC